MAHETRRFLLIPLVSSLPVTFGACLGTDDASGDDSDPIGVRDDTPDDSGEEVDGPNGGNRPDPDGDGGSDEPSDPGTDPDDPTDPIDPADPSDPGDPGSGVLPESFLAVLSDFCERAAVCDEEFYASFSDADDCVAQNEAPIADVIATNPDCADALEAFLACVASEPTCDDYALYSMCQGAYEAYYAACAGYGYGYGDYGYGDYYGYDDYYGDYGYGDYGYDDYGSDGGSGF